MEPDNLIQLRKELERDEGLRYESYQDSVGLWTIGVGHLLGEKRRMTEITFSECEALFTQDVKIAEQIIRRFVPKVGQYVIQGLGEGLKKGSYAISPIRERALINMAFNLGYRLSGFKKFLAAVNAEDWETAAKEMMDSKWAQQVGDRAVRLRDQILNG